MAQWRRIILGSLALLVVLVILAIGGIRGSRGSFSPPDILKPNMASVAVGHVHAFAARAGTNVVLFDTGPDPAGEGLDALLKAINASRKDVHDVFLTHCHGDHVAGAPLFPEARTWVGDGDVGMCDGSVPPEALMARVMSWVNTPPSVAATHRLTTDESVDVGVHQLVRAIPTPGHTPGSYAFLFDDVLFIGDSLVLDKGALKPAPGLFNPHPDAVLKALRGLKEALGDVPLDRVCAAHGGCTEPGGGAKALNDFLAANPAA